MQTQDAADRAWPPAPWRWRRCWPGPSRRGRWRWRWRRPRRAASRPRVDEDGTTRLRERYIVSAPLAGRLARITLREGDPVEAGAVVATLTPVLSPLLDERTLRELQARVETRARPTLQRAASAHRAAPRSALDAGAQRAAAQRAAGAAGLRRADQARHRPPGRAGGAEGAGDRQSRSGTSPRHELEQARAALAAVQRRDAGGRRRLRAALAGGRPRAAGAAGQRGHRGARHAAARDRRHRAAGGRGRAADHRRAGHAARAAPVRIERWGGAGALQGARAPGRAGGLHQGVGAGRRGAARQRADRPHQPGRSSGRRWATASASACASSRCSEAQVLRVPVSAVFPLPAGGGRARRARRCSSLDGGRAPGCSR